MSARLFASLFAFATASLFLVLDARAEGASAVPNADGAPSAAPVAPAAPPPSTAPVAPPPSVDAAPVATAPAPEQDRATDRDDELRTVYISVSPLHLIGPIGEGQAEFRILKRMGIAGIFGAGTINYGGYRFKVWEAGGQVVAYPFGDFDHGMQAGVEALYVNLATSDTLPSNVEVSGTASGLGLSPLVGYKWASKVGFTLNVQAGVTFVAARADATDGKGNTAQRSDQAIGPLFNFNLGWSF